MIELREPSPDEIQEIVGRLAAFEINADDVLAMPFPQPTKEQIFGLGLMTLQYRLADERRKALGGPQKRAYRLLRSLLTPEQIRSLRANGAFVVTCPSGRSYRLWPSVGLVERVVRRGSRWWIEGRYCYHEERTNLVPTVPEAHLIVDSIPSADRTVGHLLLLLADEERFLVEANWTARRNHGWDSQWMTRRAAIRREARELAATEGIGYDEAMDRVLDLGIARRASLRAGQQVTNIDVAIEYNGVE